MKSELSPVRLLSALALACVTTGCSPKFVSRPMTGSGWLELKSQHFRLRTSLRESQALDTINYLETTRAAMLQLAWGGSDGPPGRTEVVVFARGTQFDTFVDSYIAGETMQLTGFGRIIVFSPNTSLGQSSIAAHELAHDLSAWYMPLQPAWLAEGLASFLETVRFGRKTQLAYVGAPPAARVMTLGRHPRIDTAKLFAASSTKEYGQSYVGAFYAQSWLLVHYLIEEQSEPFALFQRRLSAMAGWRDAYDFSMPAGLEPGPELDRVLSEYWADRETWGDFSASAPLTSPELTPDVRPMAAAEVHGLYSWLLHRDRERAEREANEALRLDPAELSALRTKMFFLPSTPQSRAEIGKRAVRAHSRDVEAWLLALAGAGSDAEKVHALLEAERLDREHPEVQATRGYFEVQAGRAKQALPYLTAAIRRVGPATTLMKAYITALAQNDRCLEARQITDGQIRGYTEERQLSLKAAYLAACGPAVQPAPALGAKRE